MVKRELLGKCERDVFKETQGKDVSQTGVSPQGALGFAGSAIVWKAGRLSGDC